MLNIISLIIGFAALALMIPSTIPFLGWGNWVVIPIAGMGAIIGALSSSARGRNFCLVIVGLACVRLWLGGGII